MFIVINQGLIPVADLRRLADTPTRWGVRLESSRGGACYLLAAGGARSEAVAATFDNPADAQRLLDAAISASNYTAPERRTARFAERLRAAAVVAVPDNVRSWTSGGAS